MIFSSSSSSSRQIEWMFHSSKMYDKVFRINLRISYSFPPLIFFNRAFVWLSSCFFSLVISSCWVKILNTSRRQVGLDKSIGHKTMTSNERAISFYCYFDDDSPNLVFSSSSSWIPSIRLFKCSWSTADKRCRKPSFHMRHMYFIFFLYSV